MHGIGAELSLWPARLPGLWPQLLRAYEEQAAVCPELHYADKSHQLLWHWEELVRSFPGCWFWVVRRGLEFTISSMLRHPAFVERFQSGWPYVEMPSRVLGISSDLRLDYGALRLEERAALCWAAADYEGSRLLQNYPRAIEIRYESLVQDSPALLERARVRMGLAQPFPTAGVRPARLRPDLLPGRCRWARERAASFVPWW